MEDSDLGILIIFSVIAFIWLLPLLVVISSSKSTGGKKIV